MSNLYPNENILAVNFEFRDFLLSAVKRWRIILCLVVACITFSLAYLAFFVTPLYPSNAKLYIINKNSESITSSDFNISTYLINDFTQILSDTVILSEVAENLNNKYSVREIESFVSIIGKNNTRIIEIRVASPNAEDSKRIADSICRISEERLPEIMGLDRVKIIREATLSKMPENKDYLSAFATGGFIGLVISALYVFIVLISKNKINSEKDIEQYLGLNVLATIPYNQAIYKKK